MKKMSKKNPLAFLDVSIDGDPAERMVFELFSNAAPMTAENFRALCTGEKGSSPKTGRPLHYKGSFFHRIVKGLLVQGGDFLNRDGTCGESIYGEKFPDEPISKLKHDERGMLTMAVADRETRGSLFSVTFEPSHQLDRKYVVFGKLVQGCEVLDKIENVGDEDGWPSVTVKIVNCGEFFDEKKKRGKDGSSVLHGVNCEGKRKKSSRHRRKRRKYYSSESETSLDSETESSDSDSNSDSESSSLSSSSDDKRKKRKRSSKRDRYKHQKKRNKRREKKRRKRAKKSKRQSKRASDSLTCENSQSESSDDGIKQSHKTSPDMIALKQPSVADGAAAPEKGTTDIYEKVEYPSKNGHFQSNGADSEEKAGTTANKPDVVDDHPGKSRSRSLSPKRSLSKSMSISHEKSLSPRQSIRGPSFERSPKLTSQRSRTISRSPVRDVKRNLSRSPVKFSLVNKRKSSVKTPSRRSISRSPIKAKARSSFSRSPVSDRGRSLSRSPVRDVKRSLSRSPMRDVKRSLSRSPIQAHARRSYSRSPVSDRGRSLSQSPRDESPKRIRRGRGFSQRFSYARRYRTPSPDNSPVRSYRYGRNDRERYRRSPRYNRSPQRDRTPPRNSPRRYRSPPSPVRRSPRRYRSPPRERAPLRSRKSRTRSPLSQSPTRYRAESRTPPSRSRSPLITRPSPRPPSPKRASIARSSSSSRSPVRNNDKGLVSYEDGSPDFNQS